MTPNMNPKKSEWMELAESDGSTRDVRRIDKRLTFGTLAAVSAIIIGGSLFANAQDETSASAEVAVASPSATASTTASATAPSTSTPTAKAVTPATPKAKVQAPSIAQMPNGGRGDGDDDREGKERHEFRGDHPERGENHDFENDDD